MARKALRLPTWGRASSQSPGEPVVGLVPPELLGELLGGGGVVDDEELGAGDAREVLQCLAADGRGQDGVVRAACEQPALGGRREVRRRLPDGPRDRQPRER